MSASRLKHRCLMLYSGAVRLCTALLPDEVPIFRVFRGFLYGLAMPRRGQRFEVSSGVIIWGLEYLHVGSHVYVGPGVKLICLDDVSIGNGVLIGPNVVVSNGNHVFREGAYQRAENVTAPVRIGDGSWVGANATIVAGTVLGCGVLACANSCVRGTVEDYAIVGGVPAKPIGFALHQPPVAVAS